MNFRYYTGRALRMQYHPFGEFEGTELRSEEYDSIDDFIADAIEKEKELLIEYEEGDQDDESDVTN